MDDLHYGQFPMLGVGILGCSTDTKTDVLAWIMETLVLMFVLLYGDLLSCLRRASPGIIKHHVGRGALWPTFPSKL